MCLPVIHSHFLTPWAIVFPPLRGSFGFPYLRKLKFGDRISLTRVLPGFREFVVQRSVEVWLELPAKIIRFDLGRQLFPCCSGFDRV